MIEEKVKEIISKQLGVSTAEIKGETSFVMDLGADSLETVELIMAFEEVFGIEIPYEDAGKIIKVKDAVEYIHGKKSLTRIDQKGVGDEEKNKSNLNHCLPVNLSGFTGGMLR